MIVRGIAPLPMMEGLGFKVQQWKFATFPNLLTANSLDQAHALRAVIAE